MIRSFLQQNYGGLQTITRFKFDEICLTHLRKIACTPCSTLLMAPHYTDGQGMRSSMYSRVYTHGSLVPYPMPYYSIKEGPPCLN